MARCGAMERPAVTVPVVMPRSCSISSRVRCTSFRMKVARRTKASAEPGGRHAARSALEQRAAELTFEFGQVARHRGLRNLQGAGGGPDAAHAPRRRPPPGSFAVSCFNDTEPGSHEPACHLQPGFPTWDIGRNKSGGGGEVAEEVDVLIVGAGPVGLSLAIELGLRGVACQVIERNDRVGYSPRAKMTNVRSREHLRRWGIAEKLREASPIRADYPCDVVFATRMAGVPLARFDRAFSCGPRAQRPVCGRRAVGAAIHAGGGTARPRRVAAQRHGRFRHGTRRLQGRGRRRLGDRPAHAHRPAARSSPASTSSAADGARSLVAS